MKRDITIHGFDCDINMVTFGTILEMDGLEYDSISEAITTPAETEYKGESAPDIDVGSKEVEAENRLKIKESE